MPLRLLLPSAAASAVLLLAAACCVVTPATALTAGSGGRGIAICRTSGPSQAANQRQHDYIQQLSVPAAGQRLGGSPKGHSRENGAGTERGDVSDDGKQIYTVPVWFHIFRGGSKQAQGDVSKSYIDAQIDQLNRFYKEHRFAFRLAGVTKKTSWSLWDRLIGRGGRREYPAKAKTHRGSWETLNIWVTGNLADSALVDPAYGQEIAGFARFPYDPETLGAMPNELSPVLRLDGITINHNQLFRNSSGKLTTTIPHETGHWLGLFHTFQGGCQTPGDGVADTPYESTPGFGCATRNTCTTRPGLDPIHNIMDYSSDDCQRGFTKGQGERMRRIYNLFRNPKTRRWHKYLSEKMVYKYVLGYGQVL